jgi:hypothetical protein
MARLMNISLDFAEIYPNAGGGQVVISHTDFVCLSYAALSGTFLDELIIPYIMVLSAGAIAERMFYPEYVEESTHRIDKHYARKMYEVVVNHSHNIPPTHQEIILCTEKILSKKKNKRLIRKVAAGLFFFGQLSASRLKMIQ